MASDQFFLWGRRLRRCLAPAACQEQGGEFCGGLWNWRCTGDYRTVRRENLIYPDYTYYL